MFKICTKAIFVILSVASKSVVLIIEALPRLESSTIELDIVVDGVFNFLDFVVHQVEIVANLTMDLTTVDEE